MNAYAPYGSQTAVLQPGQGFIGMPGGANQFQPAPAPGGAFIGTPGGPNQYQPSNNQGYSGMFNMGNPQFLSFLQQILSGATPGSGTRGFQTPASPTTPPPAPPAPQPMMSTPDYFSDAAPSFGDPGYIPSNQPQGVWTEGGGYDTSQ